MKALRPDSKLGRYAIESVLAVDDFSKVFEETQFPHQGSICALLRRSPPEPVRPEAA